MTSSTIRIDENTKIKAQKLSKNLGLSFNTVVNALLKKFIREGGVDLRVQKLTENGLTPEFEQSVLNADKEGGYMEFDSVDNLIKYSKEENNEN